MSTRKSSRVKKLPDRYTPPSNDLNTERNLDTTKNNENHEDNKTSCSHGTSKSSKASHRSRLLIELEKIEEMNRLEKELELKEMERQKKLDEIEMERQKKLNEMEHQKKLDEMERQRKMDQRELERQKRLLEARAELKSASVSSRQDSLSEVRSIIGLNDDLEEESHKKVEKWLDGKEQESNVVQMSSSAIVSSAVEKLADSFRQAIHSDKSNTIQSLRKHLPSFGGKPEDWPIFYSAYEKTKASFDEEVNLIRVRNSLEGEAFKMESQCSKEMEDGCRNRLLHTDTTPEKPLYTKKEPVYSSSRENKDSDYSIVKTKEITGKHTEQNATNNVLLKSKVGSFEVKQAIEVPERTTKKVKDYYDIGLLRKLDYFKYTPSRDNALKSLKPTENEKGQESNAFKSDNSTEESPLLIINQDESSDSKRSTKSYTSRSNGIPAKLHRKSSTVTKFEDNRPAKQKSEVLDEVSRHIRRSSSEKDCPLKSMVVTESDSSQKKAMEIRSENISKSLSMSVIKDMVATGVERCKEIDLDDSMIVDNVTKFPLRPTVRKSLPNPPRLASVISTPALVPPLGVTQPSSDSNSKALEAMRHSQQLD
ncbi:myosin-M heavy chain-like [Macrosteles quadrilineatus]|uniref:myosin-M heavy chain-like n=1 Tax=Macrosteles quadrilineatus TaxID=74068 RepID=UPI0023E1976F|nr:myosin-M heavy chain-like [Macrosteles quadrilineatus]